jgi:long-chain acyl-CoA synthetase
MFREAVLAKPAEAIDIAEMLSRLPRRVHEVIDQYAAQTPQHPALVENTVTWSYRELHDAVRKIAAALQSLGIRPGDRIMIVSENCIALAGLLFAASRIDAWAIVVNPRLSPREFDQISDHSGARRVLFTVGVSREAADHAARGEAHISHIGPLNDIGIGALNEQATAEPVEESSARQVAVLIYTSGTTGTPKGVMLTHENLLISAKTTAWFRKMDANDRVYVVLPISHIVGIALLIMTLMSGATVRLVSKYDPAALAKAIAEEGNDPQWRPRHLSKIARIQDYRRHQPIGPWLVALDCGCRCAVGPRSEVAGAARTRPVVAQRLRYHRMFARHLRCADRQPEGRSGGRDIVAGH